MNISNSKKRFFQNGIMLTAVGLVMRTVTLIFSAFITRQVGAEGVGLYTVVMTVYNFAVTFATSGISLTVTRLVAAKIGEGRVEDVGRVLKGSIIYALIFSTAASLVLLLGASPLAGGVLSDIRAVASLKILAPSLIPIALVSVFSGYFVGVRRVSRNAVTQVLSQLFKIGITVLLVVSFGTGDVERASAALALGTTLTELLSFLVIFIEFLIDRHRQSGGRGLIFKEVAGMAVPLALSAYIRSALITLEHILIPKRLRVHGEDTGEALASYGILHGMALPLVLYPMATLSSFSGLLVPEFAERDAAGDAQGMRRIAARAFETTLIYAVVCSVLLFLFSEELGYVIYSSYPAGIYIAVLAPVLPIMYLDHVTDAVLKGIGEHVYSMWVNITDSILSVILVFVLIPKMGIMGYAVVIVVMEGYNFILSLQRLTHKIKFKISFMRAIALPLIASLGAALICRCLFYPAGTAATWGVLIAELVFTVCMTVGIYYSLSLILLRQR